MRWRRVAMVGVKVIAGVVAAVVAAIVVVIVLAHTAWGRAQVRDKLQSAVSDKINGRLEIGKLGGSVLSSLTLRNVRILGPDGNTVLAAKSVSVDYNPLALARHHLVVSQLTAAGLRVHLWKTPSGKLNLTALKPPQKAGKPSAWTVDLRHVVVEGGVVTYRAPGGNVHALRDLSLNARVHAKIPEAEVAVTDFTGLYANRKLAVAGHGTVLTRKGWIGLRDVALRAGASRLRIPTAQLARPSGAASATVTADIGVADLARLWPKIGWRSAIHVGGTVARAAAAKPWTASLRGRTGGGRLTLSAELDPARKRARATVAVAGIDPRALAQQWPAGSLTGRAKASMSMTGAGFRAAVGSLSAVASGKLAGVDIEHLRARARLAAGELHAGADLTTAAGTATAQADVTLTGPTPVIDSAHLRADLTHPQRIAGLRTRLSGTLRADLTAHGPVGDLSAAGTITGADLAFRDIRADTLTVQAEVQGIGGLPSGTLTAVADGASYQGSPLGRVRAHAELARVGDHVAGRFAIKSTGGPFSVSGRIVVARRAGALHIGVKDLEIRLPRLAWRGGGRFVIGPGTAVTAERFALSSPAGSVRVRGRLWPLSAVHAAASVAGLDLAAATAGFSARPPPLRGVVDARAAVTAHPLSFDVSAAATGLAWRPGGPPLAATLRASLAGRRLRGSASASGPRLGRVIATFDVRTPAHALSARAWRSLGAGSVRAVDVSATDLHVGPAGSVAGLSAVTGPGAGAAGMTGTLSGTVRYRGAGDRLTAALHLRGGHVEEVRAPLAADLRAQGTRDHIRVDIAGDLGGARVLTASGRVGVGVASLLARIRRGNAGAVPVRAKADVRDLDLGQVARALASPGLVRGRLGASATLAGTLARPAATLRASVPAATIGGVLFETAQGSATLGGGRYTAKISARQLLGGAISAHAEGALSPASARIAARMSAFRLDFLTPILRRASAPVSALAGSVTGQITLAAGAGVRKLTGTLRVDNGTFALERNLQPLRGVDARLSIAGGRVSITASGRSGGGTLAVTAHGRMTGLVPDRFTATVRAHELPFIAAGTRLESSAVATIEGTRRPKLWRLAVDVSSGALWLPTTLTKKLYDTGPLDGVTYVGSPGSQTLTGMIRRFAAPTGPALRVELTAPSFEVRGAEGVRAELSSNLDATLLGGHLYVKGDVSVRNGHIKLFDRDYEIVHARAGFDGSSPPNPTLDARLVHHFTDLALYVDLGGTLDRPKIHFFSNPPTYSRAELFGFFLGGEPGTITPAPGTGATSAASAVFAGVLQTVLKRSIPISEVQIGPARPGAAGPSYVTVGTWVTSNVFVAYRRRFQLENLPGESTNEAVAQFRISDRWRIVGSFGTAGTGSVDILWIKRFRPRR